MNPRGPDSLSTTFNISTLLLRLLSPSPLNMKWYCCLGCDFSRFLCPQYSAVMSRRFVYRVLGEGQLYKGRRWERSGQCKGRRETGYREGPGDDIEGQAVCVSGLLLRKPPASIMKGKAKLVTPCQPSTPVDSARRSFLFPSLSFGKVVWSTGPMKCPEQSYNWEPDR